MRKFIISDIHGDGNIYNSIMGYLDNVSKKEQIILYINGDLIDRGIESASILLDIIDRIKTNKFEIVYLGGNHELMMHQAFEKRKKEMNKVPKDWYRNGGNITDDGLKELLHNDNSKILEVSNFISNLNIYHKFEEKIDGKRIVLVHASSSTKIEDKCNLKIKDNNLQTFFHVWSREDDPKLPFRCKIGNKDYFTIVGHTPNNNKFGYVYKPNENYLNIDGGCAPYVSGYFQYDHIPLVEVKNDYLKILTFNHNNEIIYGNYFTDNTSIPLSEYELNIEQSYLNNNFKPKKLVKLTSGKIGYKNKN